MKTLVLSIIALGVALSATAQNAEYSVKKGDVVSVNREAKTFETGETIPAWVYDTAFTVIQVSSKYHPKGVLLDYITSWVTMESVGCHEVLPEPEPQPEPAPAPAPKPEPKPQPKPQPKPEPKPAPAPAPVVEPEPEPQPEPEPEHLLPAQHRFGIGVKGGVGSLLQTVSDKAAFDGFSKSIGVAAGLDLQYTYYWKGTKYDSRVQHGIQTGVSLLFVTNTVKANGLTAQYDLVDGEQHPIHYTVNAINLRETNNQLMVEIPLMYAFRHISGFNFAIGPKFNLPVYGWYKTDYYYTPTIDAYFTQYDVHETNEVVTGKLDNVAPQGDTKLRTVDFNLNVGAEIGYEWGLANGSALGLLAYGSVPVLSTYTVGTAATNFIQVGSPKAGGPDIKTYSIMNSYGKTMNYFDAGVKVVYHFVWKK